MATAWDAIAAVKCRADVPRSECAEFLGEIEGEVGDVACDELAEVIAGQGVERRLAAKCAEAVMAKRMADGEEIGNAAKWEEAVEALRMMVIRLVQAPKPRFSAGCLLLAMGVEHDGVSSSRAWAKRQSVCHELAANEVEEWQRILGLSKAFEQKSARALRVYQNTNGRQLRKAA